MEQASLQYSNNYYYGVRVKYGNGENKVKAVLNSFIPCVIFHIIIKAGLGGAVMLHNLGCSPNEVSPHEQCALLHTPGQVFISPLLQGVVGAAQVPVEGLNSSQLFQASPPLDQPPHSRRLSWVW